MIIGFLLILLLIGIVLPMLNIPIDSTVRTIILILIVVGLVAILLTYLPHTAFQ